MISMREILPVLREIEKSASDLAIDLRTNAYCSYCFALFSDIADRIEVTAREICDLHTLINCVNNICRKHGINISNVESSTTTEYKILAKPSKYNAVKLVFSVY